MGFFIWLFGLTTAASGAMALTGYAFKRVPQRYTYLFFGAFCVAGLLWIVAAGIARREGRYAEYLEDCMTHRPKYECVLLWRASDGSSKGGDPIIIPQPIPMR